MRYASAAARDTSIPAPIEGSLAYLQDSNTVTYYDGTVWQTVLVVAATDALYVEVAGDTMAGILNMGARRISNLAAPVAADDAVSRTYVRTELVQITPGSDQTITNGNLILGGGGYINAYDTNPPGGGDLNDFQTRNIIARDSDPTGADGKNGDVFIRYSFNPAVTGADVYVKVNGTWRGQD